MRFRTQSTTKGRTGEEGPDILGSVKSGRVLYQLTILGDEIRHGDPDAPANARADPCRSYNRTRAADVAVTSLYFTRRTTKHRDIVELVVTSQTPRPTHDVMRGRLLVTIGGRVEMLRWLEVLLRPLATQQLGASTRVRIDLGPSLRRLPVLP